MGESRSKATEVIEFPDGPATPDAIRAGVEARLGRALRMLVESPPVSMELRADAGSDPIEIAFERNAVTVRYGRVGLDVVSAVQRTLVDAGGVRPAFVRHEYDFAARRPAPRLEEIHARFAARAPETKPALSNVADYASPVGGAIVQEGMLATWNASFWFVVREGSVRVDTIRAHERKGAATMAALFALLEELGGTKRFEPR